MGIAVKAGFGKSEVNFPDEIFPIEKFVGVCSPIYTRMMIIEGEQKQVFISIEFTSLRDYVIENIQSLISKQLEIEAKAVWVNVTHTFSVPHTRSEEALSRSDEETRTKNSLLCQAIYDSVDKALSIAKTKMQAVTIGFGNAYSVVNVNRDIETNQGWWIGANDLGVSDKCVPIIKFENLEGKLLGLLYSFDVQSSIMENTFDKEGFRKISGDLIGTANQFIEQQYDDVVAMFLLGTAADQAPLFKASHTMIDPLGNISKIDIGTNGYVLVNALGKKLGDSVVLASSKITTEPILSQIKQVDSTIALTSQKIPKDMKEIKPTKNYSFEKADAIELGFSIFTVGNIAIIGLKPELSSLTGMNIKKDSPFPLTIVSTMINGGAKYLVDRSGYDRITYESMNSMFTSGSAELLAKKIVTTLNEIRKE